jgi:hypothetical protein
MSGSNKSYSEILVEQQKDLERKQAYLAVLKRNNELQDQLIATYKQQTQMMKDEMQRREREHESNMRSIAATAFIPCYASSRVSSSSTYPSASSSSTSSFIPSTTAIVDPTYQQSMEIVSDLSKGYQYSAKANFVKYQSYYLGVGKCYLPDILKGAIDGNAVEFVDFLIEQTASMTVEKIEELYKSFARLDGVNGKDPVEYSNSRLNFVLANHLHAAEVKAEAAAKRSFR